MSDGHRDEEHVDPMPWPHELGLYINDPRTNLPRFWPWPNKDWLFNKHALDAVSTVVYMERLLKKSGEMWTESDNAFYKAIYAEPEVEEDGRNNIAL